MIVPWGAGGGTDATARIVAALLEKDLGQPFNVVNRTGGSGVVGHSAIATAQPDGYTHRHDHGRNLDDALAGAHRAGAEELHAARADERGPAGRPVKRELALQDRQGARRRHQGGAGRQAEGVRHRPGRHLASRAGRLAEGDGPCGQSRGLGAVERRRARNAGSRGRRPRPRHLLGAGSARHHRGRQGARLAIMAPERNPSFKDVPTLKEADGHRLFDRRLARHRGAEGPAARTSRRS